MSNSSVDPNTLPLCDIVMEGGITSGVIYPKAVVKLSEKFRIKNIGGSSAGAIAAAATAAAELGRLKDPKSNPGYTRLAGLAEELAGKNPNHTPLQNLFQPQDETRPLFVMLIKALNQKSKKGIAWGLVLGALCGFPWRSIVAFATPIAFAIVLGHQDLFTWIITALISLVLVLAVLLCAIWSTLKGPMVDNGYGICKGYDQFASNPKPGQEPLTLWLSRLLNECAGKACDGEPLTFGELWKGTEDEKSAPPAWLQSAGLTKWERYVDLQMMTTNITHGRPYRFPYKDDDQKLFFNAYELKNWFPSNVVDHLVDKSPTKNKNEIHLQLPESEDLPVVFVTRLSLSFPFLLCAVPLYAMDCEINERKIERCWFSDGGICSNFPIHFFDAPLPMWPTFGIKLEGELTRYWEITDDLNTNPSVDKNDRNRFFFPKTNEQGRGDSWARFDDESNGGQRLFGFTAGLLDAARNWHDHMLMRAPGVRDRVVRVYLKNTEGGLNLDMGENLIKGLSMVGEEAATMLNERFSPESRDQMNFDNHRWGRLRNLAAVTEQDLSSLHRAISAPLPDVTPWPDLISNATTTPPNGERYSVDAFQAQKIEALLSDLDNLSKNALKQPNIMQDSNAPKRTPVIRIVPNI